MDFLRDRPAGYEHLTPQMCIACKGSKGLCGKPCILLARIDDRLPRLRITTQDVQGPSPPGLFVGRYGYPTVGVGPLVPPIELDKQQVAALDDPAAWARVGIEDVLGMRSSLLRTNRRQRVRSESGPDRFLKVTQELAMASAAVDTEVHLSKRPNLAITARVGDVAAPMGPRLDVDRARLTQNPRVSAAVERLVGDTHAATSTAITELADGGLGVHQIERLLAVGLLGRQGARRLVPTRWSITATDDMMGKRLVPSLMDWPLLDDVEVRFIELHGNRFHVLLLPQTWAFDMIETWIKGAMWALEDSPLLEDWEDWRGRTGYAARVAGAYYAARLAVLEHLTRRRRQAAVFVYREITPAYWAPLGVWVIREAVRLAMKARPNHYQDTRAAIAAVHVQTHRSDWAASSWLLGRRQRQCRLSEWRT